MTGLLRSRRFGGGRRRRRRKLRPRRRMRKRRMLCGIVRFGLGASWLYYNIGLSLCVCIFIRVGFLYLWLSGWPVGELVGYFFVVLCFRWWDI